MIILSKVLVLRSNAVNIRRDLSILFNRVAILLLIYCNIYASLILMYHILFYIFIKPLRYVLSRSPLLLAISNKYGYITSLCKNYLMWLIFNIRLYQFLSIVFIHVAVLPIQIDWNLGIEVFKNFLQYLGLLDAECLKNGASWSYVIWGAQSSHRICFGFRTSIFISLIFTIMWPILFVLNNIVFIIISMLSVILVKALALNFYKKHFKYFYNGSAAPTGVGSLKWAKLVHLVRQIINNIYKIIKYLLKIWIISVILIFTFRAVIATMLLNSKNNSLSIILTLTLPLPIFLYLLNFITKYLKKEDIKPEDYYLYNDYVVDRVNLYRISYIVFINYLIRNYCSTLCISIVTIVLTVLLLVLLTICILYGLQRYKRGGNIQSTIAADYTGINKNKPLALKAVFEPTAAYITAFIAITPFLQEGCNKGFIDYYLNTGSAKYYDWKRVIFKNPGVIKRGLTVNIMENKKLENVIGQGESIRKDLLSAYRPQLDKSPIINMTWKLKYNEGVQRSQDKFTVKPINYFTNPEFYGAVSLVLQGRFLIVNIIRRDSPGCVFIPTYCLPDLNDPKSLTKIVDTVSLLEDKYGIAMPRLGIEKANNRTNGLVIFTQAESIDKKSLFRVWRPSVNFTEPELKTVNNYYKEKSKNTVRLRQFDNSIKLAENIDETIKAQQRYLDVKDKVSDRREKGIAKYLAMNEYSVDEIYKQLVQFYITKGQIANPDDFTVLNQDRRDKPGVGYKDLSRIARFKNKRLINWEKSLAPEGREQTKKEALELLKSQFKRFYTNNEYIDNKYYYFQTRRDYPINSLLLTKDKSHTTQFSIYKEGVIEGYMEKLQTLGELDSSLQLPLVESRIELIEKIASNFTSSEYKNLNNIYGVSINRLTFEFFELIPTNNKYFGIYEGGWTSQQFLDKNRDCEVYSIIDVKNDSLKFRANFRDGVSYDMDIPKHDYNLLDNKDELSIRRFMDFIYPNSDGYLTYESNKDNFSVLTQKQVGFSKKAIDYKGKEPKVVYYTQRAIKKKVLLGERILALTPFYSYNLLNNIPNKYHRISLDGERATFNYKPKRIFIAKAATKPGVLRRASTNGYLEITEINDIDENESYIRDNKKFITKTLISPNRPLTKVMPKAWKTQSGTVVELVANYSADMNMRIFFPTGYLYLDKKSSGSGSENIPRISIINTFDKYGFIPEEPDNSAVLATGVETTPVVPSGPVNKGGTSEEPNNSSVRPTDTQARPPVSSAWLINEEEEDIYGYSGDEGDNSKNKSKNKSKNNSAAVKASVVQGGEQPVASKAKRVRFASPLEQVQLLEDDSHYIPYTEEGEQPVVSKAKRVRFASPLEQVQLLEDSLGYMPFTEEGEQPVTSAAKIVHFTSPEEQVQRLEDDSLYIPYSEGESTKGNDNNRDSHNTAVGVSVVQGGEQPAVTKAKKVRFPSPQVQPLEDHSLGYIPYSEEGETTKGNDNNRGSHRTAEDLADKVTKPEVSELIVIDDIYREGAPSPQFYIAEATSDYISSEIYNPSSIQDMALPYAAAEGNHILEPHVINSEPMELDTELVKEVMTNTSGQAPVEYIDPVLLHPIELSNPEAVSATSPLLNTDSELTILENSKLFALEGECNPNASNKDAPMEVEDTEPTVKPSIVVSRDTIIIGGRAVRNTPARMKHLMESGRIDAPREVEVSVKAEDRPLSNIGENELSESGRIVNSNTSVEVDVSRDIYAPGDDLASGEKYTPGSVDAPYGVNVSGEVYAPREVEASDDVDASGEEDVPWNEDSQLSTKRDCKLVKLERKEASRETIDPFTNLAEGQVGEPEVIIISSDDSSSEDTPSPPTAVQVGETEGIIISSDNSSSEYTYTPLPLYIPVALGCDVSFPTPHLHVGAPEGIIIYEDNSSSEKTPSIASPYHIKWKARSFNAPVAEVIDLRTGTKFWTVDMNIILAVITKQGREVPRLWRIGRDNKDYYLSVDYDTDYAVFPRDLRELPGLGVRGCRIAVFLPPGVDTFNVSDEAEIPGGIESLPDIGETDELLTNLVEGVFLDYSIRPNNLERSLSEPLEDKNQINSSNFSRSNYNDGTASNSEIPEASQIPSSGIEDREVNMADPSDSKVHSSSENVSTRAVISSAEEGEPEVTIISPDAITINDIYREGAPSPYFYLPEPSPDSMSIDSPNSGDVQASQEQDGHILESHLINPEPMELDTELVKEVMTNASGQAPVKYIDPFLLKYSQSSNLEPIIESIDPLTPSDARVEGEGEAVIISSGGITSEGITSPHGKEGAPLDRDNASIPSPNLQPAQDNTDMDIDEYNTDMDIDEDNKEGWGYGQEFLEFDPCGPDTDFFGYGYQGDTVRRCEDEALNIQARYEDMVSNSQPPSPLSTDTEAPAIPTINTSNLSGESVGDHSRAEVAMTALSDTQASQEQDGHILESHLINPEPMELDTELVKEVMTNASGQAPVKYIDPVLLHPIELSNP